jgi:hypothetical protein
MLDNYNGATPPGTFTLLQIHLGDGYASTWGNGRDTFYAVSGTPDAWFDGALEASGAYTNVDSQYNWYLQQYNQRRAVSTDVTIALSGVQTSGQTFQFTANVCVEPSGTGKTLRVHLVQVLDVWPTAVSYSRNGVKQGATYADITLNPGQCEQVVRSLTFDAESWSHQSDIKVIAFAQAPTAAGPANVYQAAEAAWPFMRDCNGNSVADECDLDCGLPSCGVPGCGESVDCDNNGTPDECQPDCNDNDVADACDIAFGTSLDCQANGTPDECELVGHDCNANQIPDVCDIAFGTSRDCQANGTPDECELVGHDCNANQVPDVCDLAAGTSADCQPNGRPDECDVAGGTSHDCQTDGVPDECQNDCNTNGIEDSCDVSIGTSPDCNANGHPDSCDIEHCHYLWNGFQGQGHQATVHGRDFDGDGIAWVNPTNTAKTWMYGCEAEPTGGTNRSVQVGMTATPLEDGYVDSEYFHTYAGALGRDERTYQVSFTARIESSLNAKADWQYFLYDARHDKRVIEIDFAANGSTRVPAAQRGKILVKDPGSSAYLNTGVTLALNTCYQLKVVLDNETGTVQLYTANNIVDPPTLKATAAALEAGAVRLDYFRAQPITNGVSTTTTSNFKLDAFHFCALGRELPAPWWDCNGNGVLDACDLTSGFSHDCNANGIPEECELGDFDASQTVDLADYVSFQSCLTDPGGSMGSGCAAGDFDCDNDVDLDDFAWFQVALPVR